MKEPFHAVEKTAELLDRLVKEQYEAGEVEVAHDLSKLRGMMLPFSMTDRRVTEVWLRGLEEKKRQEQNGFPKHDVFVQSGINMFNKVAKEFTKLSDAELKQFLEDKVDATNVQTFVQSTVDGLKDSGYEVVGFEKTSTDLGGAEVVEETTITSVPYVPDAELDQFMKDKYNTTDTTDFVTKSIKPLSKDQLTRGIDFLEKKRKEKVDYVPRELDDLPINKEDNWSLDASKLPGGIFSAPALYGLPGGIHKSPEDYGVPIIREVPFEDLQQLTEQCLKCRGLGMRKYSDKVMKMCDRCQGTGRA